MSDLSGVTVHGQTTCSRIRAVVKLGNCLIDLFPGRGPDMGLGVNDPRDSLDRNAGEVGNIEYGSFGHSV